MDKTRRPPAIIHIRERKQDNRKQLCSQCGWALNMRKDEVNLLRFYSDQEQGYTPALQHIANSIHCARSTVEENRISLQRRGIILMSWDALYVDWSRIRLFSTLEPAQTRSCRVAAPVSLKLRPNDSNSYTQDIDFARFASQDDVVRYMNALSETEFQSLRSMIATDMESRGEITPEMLFCSIFR